MKGIVALYIANANEFLRERLVVFLVLLLPVALAGFFGLIFGGGGGQGSPLQLGVVNNDRGQAGGEFLAVLTTSELTQTVNLHSGSREEMLQALNAGQVSVVVVLPREMTDALLARTPVTIEALYDPAQAAAAGAGLGLVQNLLNETNLTLSGAPQLLVMEETSVQTHPQSKRPVEFHMPGMLGIAALWLGLFGTAMPLVQQRAGQVLRRLSVTPVTPAAMLVAQVGWRVTVGLLQAALFMLVGYVGFGVRVAGSWPLFIGVVTLGTLVFISMGYMLAGVTRSAEGAVVLSQILNMPMTFLSGSLIAIEILPAALRPVVKILPLTYLSDALRQVMVGAPPLYPLWLDLAVLGGCLALFMTLAVKFWRWE